MFQNLNDDNITLYAAKMYDRPNAVMSEFEEDLNRILYIKRLLTKYYSTGIFKERLMLNHIIVLYNVFGVEAATRILFFKLEDSDLRIIKPLLIYLNFLPKVVKGIKGKDIITNNIQMDWNVVDILRKIGRTDG